MLPQLLPLVTNGAPNARGSRSRRRSRARERFAEDGSDVRHRQALHFGRHSRPPKAVSPVPKSIRGCTRCTASVKSWRISYAASSRKSWKARSK